MAVTSGLFNGGGNDDIQQGKVPFPVRAAFFKKNILFAGADAAAGGFGVGGVPLVRHFHALDDFAEGDEGFAIMGGGVVAEVDEDLGGAAVGDGKGEGDGAAGVGEDARVVGDGGGAPRGGDGRVRGDAELGPVALPDAPDFVLVVVAVFDEVVKAVGTVGGPFAPDFDKEIALGGVKANVVERR